MKHRVLIVEDHHLLRQGLRAMVAALPDFEVVAEAKGWQGGHPAGGVAAAGLILMDLSLPRMTGIEATTADQGAAAANPHRRVDGIQDRRIRARGAARRSRRLRNEGCLL